MPQARLSQELGWESVSEVRAPLFQEPVPLPITLLCLGSARAQQTDESQPTGVSNQMFWAPRPPGSHLILQTCFFYHQTQCCGLSVTSNCTMYSKVWATGRGRASDLSCRPGEVGHHQGGVQGLPPVPCQLLHLSPMLQHAVNQALPLGARGSFQLLPQGGLLWNTGSQQLYAGHLAVDFPSALHG